MNKFSKFQLFLLLSFQTMPSAAAAKVATLESTTLRLNLPELKRVLHAEAMTAGLRRNRLEGPVYVSLRYFLARYSLLASGGRVPSESEVLELRLEIQRLFSSAESKLNQVSVASLGTVVDSVALSFEVLAQEIALKGEARRTAGELMLADLAVSPTAVYADHASQTSALRVVQRERLSAILEESLHLAESDPVFGDSLQLLFGRVLDNDSPLCAKTEHQDLCQLPARLTQIEKGESAPTLALEFVEASLLTLLDSVMQRSAVELEEIAKPTGGGKPLVDPTLRHETAVTAESSLALVQRLYSDSLPGHEAQSLKLLGRVSLGLYFAISELRREEGAGLVPKGLLPRISSIVAVQVLDAARIARGIAEKKRLGGWGRLQGSIQKLSASAASDSYSQAVLSVAEAGIVSLIQSSQGAAIDDAQWRAHILSLSDMLIQLDRSRFFLLDVGYSKALDSSVLDGEPRHYVRLATDEGLLADDPAAIENLASVVEKEEALFPLLGSSLTAPAWSRINLIRAIVSGRYKDSSLDVDGRTLPNIEKWTVAIAPLVRSVARDYEKVLLDPRPALNAIQDLLAAADRARQVSRGLKSALASAPGSVAPQAIGLALDDYARSFEHLKNTVAAERKKQEQDKFYGLEINKPFAGQTVRSDLVKIEFPNSIESLPGLKFPSAEGKVGVPLPPLSTSEFVKKIRAALPEKVKIALLLGRGKLGAWYENPQWVGEKVVSEKYDPANDAVVAVYASRPKVDFVLYFIGSDSNKNEIARFPVEGKEFTPHRAKGRETFYLYSDKKIRKSLEVFGAYYKLSDAELATVIKETQALPKYKGKTLVCDPSTHYEKKDEENYDRFFIYCHIHGVDTSATIQHAVFSPPDRVYESWMGKALASEKIDELLESAKNTTSAEIVEKNLSGLDSEMEAIRMTALKDFDAFVNTSLQTGPNTIHSALMSIAGSKALVASLLEIAMPATLVRDEAVRTKVMKGKGLPDDSSVVTFVQEGAMTLDPLRTKFFENINAHKEELKKLLREVSLASEPEFAQAAEVQYGQLSHLKRALELYLPARSIEETLEDLKLDMSAWAKP